MPKSTVRKFVSAFDRACAAARTEGGHDALRMALTSAHLPAEERARVLGAIESSERAFQRESCLAA